MSEAVVVAGVGMVPFAKPGASEPYNVMGANAVRLALADAGIPYAQVEQAYAGYVYGDSTCGQRVLYAVGMTGIPIVNVNNNCSTGSTALFLARQAVASGAIDCALVLGFEQMEAGALGTKFKDRPTPFERFDAETDALIGHPELPLAIRYFGGAGLAHMRKFGTRMETFAKIRAKASRHAVHNPLALFRKELTSEEVMAARADARRHDATDGLPADLWRSGGDHRVQRLRPAARNCQQGAHRRASDDNRHAKHLRVTRHDARMNSSATKRLGSAPKERGSAM